MTPAPRACWVRLLVSVGSALTRLPRAAALLAAGIAWRATAAGA